MHVLKNAPGRPRYLLQLGTELSCFQLFGPSAPSQRLASYVVSNFLDRAQLPKSLLQPGAELGCFQLFGPSAPSQKLAVAGRGAMLIPTCWAERTSSEARKLGCFQRSGPSAPLFPTVWAERTFSNACRLCCFQLFGPSAPFQKLAATGCGAMPRTRRPKTSQGYPHRPRLTRVAVRLRMPVQSPHVHRAS